MVVHHPDGTYDWSPMGNSGHALIATVVLDAVEEAPETIWALDEDKVIFPKQIFHLKILKLRDWKIRWVLMITRMLRRSRGQIRWTTSRLI